MHGMNTDEELDYWRERARKAEQEKDALAAKLAEVEKERDEARDQTCARHADQKHGAEAEELRRGIEGLITKAERVANGKRAVGVRELQNLLDRVDARDSLAYLEARDEKLAAVTKERDHWSAQTEKARISYGDEFSAHKATKERLDASLAAVTAERDEARAIGHDAIDKANRYMSEADAARAESERLRGEVERLKTNAPETTSDGYHTFAELYDHRITLFIALAEEVDAHTPTGFVWRSKLHSDGSKFDGWFVMGIGTQPGEQVTYHLPLSRWAETDWLGTENERAPEFDGHTSADVLARIRRYYDRSER